MRLLEKLNEIMSMKALCKLQVLAVTIMIIPQMLSYLYCSKYYNCSGQRVNILMLIIQIHAGGNLLLFYNVSKGHFILILSLKLHFGQSSVSSKLPILGLAQLEDSFNHLL